LTKWLRQAVFSPAGVDLVALMGINLCGYNQMMPTTVQNKGFTKIAKPLGYLSIQPVLILRSPEYADAMKTHERAMKEEHN